MVSLGPLPMSLVVLIVALAIAAAVGWLVARGVPGQPPVKVMPMVLDMLVVGLVAARIGFVIKWLPQYLADPWSIISMGDGGFSVWPGVLAGLAFGAWKARKAKTLRRPLMLSVIAGLVSWTALGGALALMQQSTLRLPSTELSTLDGGTASLSAMSGKPMVVNLWATWCPPCRREMPVFANAQATRADVTFVFVNQGESAESIRDFLREADLQLEHVLLDLFSSVSQELGSRGLPTTLFFDADGRLVDTHVGGLSEAGLAQKLQRFGLAPAPVVNPNPVIHKEIP